MSLRQAVTNVHVVLSCGVLLAWVAAVAARSAPWRRYHAGAGWCCAWGVIASSVLAAGLAAEAGNRFGLLFALQPLVLVLSGLGQFRAARPWRRALAVAGLVIAFGVMYGFVGLLRSRLAIDVAAFAWVALVLAGLCLADLAAWPGPTWRAHALRMLAVGWLYLAELLIFVFDPQPSVIAWGLAGLVPAAVALGLFGTGPLRAVAVWRPGMRHG